MIEETLYISAYLIGAFITWWIVIYFERGREWESDDYQTLVMIVFMWPGMLPAMVILHITDKFKGTTAKLVNRSINFLDKDKKK